ncbi:Imidazolonepropionase [Mucinivorans hirudinis]|uniref:Imidazolonepropionase n=1 Tax=Mucinivorans hirudinis TaxID=1433126 RepID=A0A060R5X0_9BACT|nr:Imidazolonepropionase [Mucinivorans hirudinis]
MIITNIKGIVGCWQADCERVAGAEMAQIPIVENGYLIVEEGVVHDFGSMDNFPFEREDFDATGRYLLPAFCDSHTHLIYAAPRASEWVDRIKGLSYEDIARRGGGILNSVDALRAKSEEELYADALCRVAEIRQTGTGAVEIKSGYGLDLENELKMLRVAARLRESTDLTIRTTLLAAHAVPREYQGNREGYVDYIIRDIIPSVAAQGIADYVDVFCDEGFFTVADTERILDKALQYGIRGKIHSNELAAIGGVELACTKGCLSADHLERMNQAAFEAFARSPQTMPTALPAASFFLGIPYTPIRGMIDRGLAVALASDFNPGSAPSGNMQFVGTLACTQASMLPTEALTASTLNSAAAMGLSHSHGAIRRGAPAALLITKIMPCLDYLYYNFGSNNIAHTLL